MIGTSALDTRICIWNALTSRKRFEPARGHTEIVNDVTFSRDDQLLISGADDYTIRLWDTNTGLETAASPITVKEKVHSVAVSPDGTKLAAGCSKGRVIIYSTATWQTIGLFTGHKDAVYPVLFSPDGCRIASSAINDSFYIWDVGTAVSLDISFAGNTKGITCLSFTPSGRYIAAGSAEKSIQVWDTQTGALFKGSRHSHQGGIYGVAFLPDGKYLASGSADRTIKIWDMDNEGEGPTPVEMEAEPERFMTLEDIVSSLGIRGCPDMTIQLDLKTGTQYPISSGGFGDIYRCKLTDGTEVAIKTIRLYNGANEQNAKHLKHAARELYTWSKCRHPNVQPLLGLAMFRGFIGMIAEWESNGTMPEYLERHSDVDRCAMSTQITEGLLYLHELRIIHGDLKGANVLISKDGVARLTDFGNAKLQKHTLQFTKSSTKETLSSRWANAKAPELFEGTFCSFEADVYALGMTILEAITGKIPWWGQSEHSVIYSVTIKKTHPERPKEHIPIYSEHGDKLWTLLEWCWAPTPENRPNASQVKERMHGITRDGLRSIETEMSDVEMN
ncbi:Tyrosine kinase family catalytic domain protein [Ceratobasidium sp. AG-Ba]|nr:Tyrosine kinase family catalytic domain protein [Ceratobasidium sp. AG-Ba]